MVDIVFASDDGFTEQLLVASSSAIYASRSGKSGFVIHVLDCGISDEKWVDYENWISSLAKRCEVDMRLERHKIDMHLFDGVLGWTNGSKATWARVLLPNILQLVDCCIYSDCDVFFVEDPSEMLEELRNSGKAIIGHKNPFGDRNLDAKWFAENNLPYLADEYFCAGLVAMNLDLMRSLDVVNGCWEFLRKYPNPATLDQAVLNYLCMSSKGILSEGWGLFVHECYRNDVKIKAIHFSGGWPWKKAKNTFDALCICLSYQANAIWHTFQTACLGKRESQKPEVCFKLRVKAVILFFICRLMLRLRFYPARLSCLLDLVRGYEGPATQIEKIKESLLRN